MRPSTRLNLASRIVTTVPRGQYLPWITKIVPGSPRAWFRTMIGLPLGSNGCPVAMGGDPGPPNPLGPRRPMIVVVDAPRGELPLAERFVARNVTAATAAAAPASAGLRGPKARLARPRRGGAARRAAGARGLAECRAARDCLSCSGIEPN